MELDCRTPTEHVQRGSAKIMSFPMSSTHLMFCRQSHPAEERFLHDATPQRVHITVLRGFCLLAFCRSWPHMSGPLWPTTHCVGEIPTRFLTAKRRGEIFVEVM